MYTNIVRLVVNRICNPIVSIIYVIRMDEPTEWANHHPAFEETFYYLWFMNHMHEIGQEFEDILS